MNHSVTSKEAILDVCRKMVSEKGLSSINMRSVAKKCEVALGTLYYYFPSKEDLLIATIESVWQHIFKVDDLKTSSISFLQYLEKLYSLAHQGTKQYPNFFTMHSLSFTQSSQSKAYNAMEIYLSSIRKQMLEVLQKDPMVHKSAFSEELTQADFIEFILSNIISSLIRQKKNCGTLTAVLTRLIY